MLGVYNMKIMTFYMFLFFTLLFQGCYSHKKMLDDEIFDSQMRILALENILRAKGKEELSNQITGDTRSKEIKLRLQRLEGDVGRLEVGVKTGILPGDPGGDNNLTTRLNNIANRVEALEKSHSVIAKIKVRIEQLERSQKEIISTLGKISLASGEAEAPIKSRSRRKSLKSLLEIERAFDKRKYLHISQDAKGLLEKVSSKDKEDIFFYYAESLFKLGKLDEAVVAFDDFSKKYPKSKRSAKVYLRFGDSLRLLGKKKQALIFYNELIDKFSRSAEAITAKKEIKGISKS